ncbi:MAG: hypothetical protein A2319_03250 [Candidatus Kerfeldbacteria bacterium RIFOXYB2_FULL_38_14]|uniref:Polymerase nucleotidyl transferase domain-containing protein n=1 Tax=Candidatus Kerfeldbacteria bacterium RIFOXYB2_FULL_38_14 TaxID=1798547 RepID=A0A1G2BAE0_9BACT|nr:MAG: hypothetical protein A2319_03250 [Candidatus Kerfeldbacteria bacterium RIFOXYB2_FULL_38_14]
MVYIKFIIMVKKKLSQKVKNEVLDFTRILQEANIPIEKVYVFGSYAKGTQNKWSDVDVCVVSKKFTNSWQATQMLWQKRQKDHGLTIEPVGFHPKDFLSLSTLTAEILKTGIRVV